MIPFNGVLISWLIFARNWLLALLAVSATKLAAFSSFSRFRRLCSIARATANVPMILSSVSVNSLFLISKARNHLLL